MKAAFFGYSWHPSGNLDAYMAEIVNALSELGLDVTIYLANRFSHRLGIKGFSNKYSIGRIHDYIEKSNYDFAISFNNAMITPEIVEALDCKIVSVLVDGINHLFDHQDDGNKSVFELDFVISPIFTAVSGQIRQLNPNASSKIHFLPPATRVARPERMLQTYAPLPHLYPISWIASLLDDQNIRAMFQVIIKHTYYYQLVLECIKSIKDNGHLALPQAKLQEAHELARYLLWDFDFFEMQLQNIVTNNDRLQIVERLAPLGLKLFGNSTWERLMSTSTSVIESFQTGHELTSHDDLMKIYDSSRISVNLPQAHVKSAFQYRIVDILASNSLLITKYSDDSDLIKVFGHDSPIVFFSSMEELEELCQHYLKHEAQRKETVLKCNALVSNGYSFKERVKDYLALSNASKFATLSREMPNLVPGKVSIAMPDLFINWTGDRS